MNKSELENLNRDKWNSDKYRLKKFTKAGVASLIGGAFIAFAVGWVFLIPTAAALFLIYGLIVYARERKNRITVSIKPTEAMKAIVRREEDIKREKEKLLYEEFQGGIKH